MKKLSTLIAITCASLQLCAKEQTIGTVNFNSCVAESKLGKQEQNALETMRKQIITLIEDTDKQLREVGEKLQDKDHLDGLSKEGEEALQTKQVQLNEELNRYHQQYYQFMQQGQNRLVQAVYNGINQVSDKIASSKGHSFLINKEMCFYSDPALDMTAEVIQEMDKNFEAEETKQEAPAE